MEQTFPLGLHFEIHEEERQVSGANELWGSSDVFSNCISPKATIFPVQNTETRKSKIVVKVTRFENNYFSKSCRMKFCMMNR